MEVNIKLTCIWPVVFVAFFIQMARCFTMGFPHEIVLTLPAKTQSFSGTRVTSIPSLCGTMSISVSIQNDRNQILTFAETYSSYSHA